MQYIQGIQPNVPARTTCRHGLYNSMLCARTSKYANPSCTARTKVPLSSYFIKKSSIRFSCYKTGLVVCVEVNNKKMVSSLWLLTYSFYILLYEVRPYLEHKKDKRMLVWLFVT